MSYDQIPQLPTDHHNAVDWQRVKRAARLQHPVRTAATLGVGIVLAPWWTDHAALPLIATYGPAAAFGLAAMTSVYASVVMANGRIRPLVRRAAAVVLVAAVAGTLFASPVRTLIAAWIMES
ncbi:hypothetical protein [Streptomyces sp. CB01881]|uniref:hypothetical protein n=1 Tax=Streptomyces sp. CB01881 TaxID=2078691 RepID=UPI000CDCD19D|nr:hypothetical protein [Streptomyces sp. CB01881]AUY51264.1 hypothetical protein C2142_22600 [Streptomyces sp. CB01881]TYC74650.1 hypothetical protein EH183_22575 [Streptomyces sp. CB01881]